MPWRPVQRGVALNRRSGKPMANHKRIFRIMRQNGMLLARHSGRRKGRLHDGKSRCHALEPAMVLRRIRDFLLER